MDKHHFRHIDHETCVAYYREALSPRHAARVRTYLEIHPAEARRARIDAELEHAIAQPLEGVLQEPLPPRLRVETRPVAKLWSGRLSLAAIIVVAALGGWWLGRIPVAADAGTTFTERVISAAQQPVRRTATPASTSTSIKIPPPDLSLQGYRLVQQRRLNSAESALIEFVYRNANGQQLRLYAETDSEYHTALTVTSQGGMSLAQWREGGTRYALVGDMSKLLLQTLAQAARADSAGDRNDRSMLAGTGRWQVIQLDGAHYGMGVRPSSLVADDVDPVSINNGYAIQPGRR